MKLHSLVLNIGFITIIVALGSVAAVRALPFELPQQAQWLRGEVAQKFESHYDESFPVKTLGINLWAAIQYLAFAEGRSGVVVGQQGWLYTEEEFSRFPDAQDRVARKLAVIEHVHEALAERGVDLKVALVPAKTRVYPEYLGDDRPGVFREKLYGQARDALAARGLDVPDLAHALIDCKSEQQVFLKTDTHWTPAGSRCAASTLSPRKQATVMAYEERVMDTEAYRGDLLKFLPLDPYFSRWLPEPDHLTRIKDAAPTQSDAAGLLGDVDAPQLVLIGTSYSADERWNFASALQEAFGEDVLNLADAGHGPFAPMLAYLRDADTQGTPKQIIWEIPERYLPAPDDTDLGELTRLALSLKAPRILPTQTIAQPLLKENLI
tara:strand:+ start:814 stop:1953 length:1140 start_codon:yes stop_codon:yes gene_type:complete